MIIKGIQKTSLVDFPPYISCTIFLPRCNLRCGYCYNTDLVLNHEKLQTIEEKKFFEFLDKRKKWLDAVCITGGEPTLHKGLIEFIKKIRKKEFKIKLDTNGTNPNILDTLIKEKIIDHIAMDIKAPLEKYDSICDVKVNKTAIKKSISILKQSKISYEFRMTIHSKMFTNKDYEAIGELLKDTKKIFIQQFEPNLTTINPLYKDYKKCKIDELLEIKKILEKYIENVEIRNA